MNTNEIKTYRLIIKGKVQGVGFRHWFSDLAISLGLNGYIQNKESKDEVEAIIQGDMQSILSITEKAKDGPSLALVEGVIPNSIISNCLLYTSPSPRDLSIRRQRQMCIRDSKVYYLLLKKLKMVHH